MSLIECLRGILHLENDPLLLDEAKRKLKGTWLIINEVPMLVIDFLFEKGVILGTPNPETTNPKIYNVSKLNLWLPDSGLYPLSDGRVAYLTKRPKRQWLKSFHESFYEIYYLGKRTLGKNINVHKEIYDGKCYSICVNGSGEIYYMNLKIGYIRDSSHIVCTNLLFQQELIDWGKKNGC